ncbi:hypothetical protein NE237_009652 [Protea cynaroides]|uniref:Xylanase inhibitor N-terminal domain-containing protein n=1 Tax=Protea cynaroides TaxID=273540 RepID=A0A9Q0KY49_9MAGN|nr:hypothetical protein NE237_009652 [Protea cynaroides]
MAASSLLLSFLFFTLFLLPLPTSQGRATSKTYSGYVLPVTKDAKTLQFMTTIKTRTPLVSVKLVVHMGGIYSWVYCDQTTVSSSFRPIPCNSTECKLAKGYDCHGSCSMLACGKKSWCRVIDGNYILSTALSEDVIALRSTYENGSRLGPLAFVNRFTIL